MRSLYRGVFRHRRVQPKRILRTRAYHESPVCVCAPVAQMARLASVLELAVVKAANIDECTFYIAMPGNTAASTTADEIYKERILPISLIWRLCMRLDWVKKATDVRFDSIQNTAVCWWKLRLLFLVQPLPFLVLIAGDKRPL